MGLKEKFVRLAKKLKFDSHHRIERFGVFTALCALSGVLVLTATGVSAFQQGRDELMTKVLYNTTFTTSKTDLEGFVDGVYTNGDKTRALVMMHFDESAKISFNASDYNAFVMGSNEKLETGPVTTDGVKGSVISFGSTGYFGLFLEATEPFDRQITMLTMRSNAELSYKETDTSTATDEDEDFTSGDASFDKHDQWQIWANLGANGTEHISALDQANFDPAHAFYDVVTRTEEQEVRHKLESKLQEMRADLRQIESYTSNMQTTKVDGVFLRPPEVPETIRGDEITGKTAEENGDGKSSTLSLKTDYVMPGGVDFDWRAGNVYDGYLDDLRQPGESYVEFLSRKKDETDEEAQAVHDMAWKLSDGTSLTEDYEASDSTMRPLTSIMNNLAESYQNYEQHKKHYQIDLALELIGLDIDLRDVQSNNSVHSNDAVTVYTQ